MSRAAYQSDKISHIDTVPSSSASILSSSLSILSPWHLVDRMIRSYLSLRRVLMILYCTYQCCEKTCPLRHAPRERPSLLCRTTSSDVRGENLQCTWPYHRGTEVRHWRDNFGAGGGLGGTSRVGPGLADIACHAIVWRLLRAHNALGDEADNTRIVHNPFS
jgi:hypothetical protein